MKNDSKILYTCIVLQIMQALQVKQVIHKHLAFPKMNREEKLGWLRVPHTR